MCPTTEKAKTKKYCLPQHTVLNCATLWPVPHCEDLLIPKPPMLESLSSASASEEEGRDADFDEASTSKEPHFPNQQEMDDLVDPKYGTNQRKCRTFDLMTQRVAFTRSYLQGLSST